MVGSDWGSVNTGGFVCQDEGSGSAAQIWLRDRAESLPGLFWALPSSLHYLEGTRSTPNAKALSSL